MRIKFLVAVASSIVLLLVGGIVVRGQQSAAVQMTSLGVVHGGGAIAFTLTLNEPMPPGAHFDLRISPVSADEEIDLGSGQPVKESTSTFRVAGTLPQDAVQGDWRIAVVWFFLPGAGWTHTSLATNDLRFHVEGSHYAIPTKAQVVLQQ